MLHFYRKTIFLIFAGFFVIILPFIVIFSLGYDKDLKNTITISVETYPRGATIYNQGQKVITTPGELRGSSNQTIQLDIKSDNYIEENFTLRSPAGENTTARLLNLWLLPRDADRTFNDPQTSFLSVLSEKYVLIERQGKYFIQGLGFSGPQGNTLAIQNSSPITKDRMEGRWETVLEDAFWQKEKKLLIFRLNNSWQLIDLENYPTTTSSIAKLSTEQFIILDDSSRLWLLNGITKELEFLDEGFSGLAFTDSPDSIWLWRRETIYRLERNPIIASTFTLDQKIYSTDPILRELSLQDSSNVFYDFVAKSLFQGISFKIRNYIFYISDFNRSSWQTITNNGQVIGTDNSTIFWIDSEKNLYSYNLFLKKQINFQKIELPDNLKDIRINYFQAWRRLFIYSNDRVLSIWFDKEVLNDPIVKYDVNTWIQNQTCYPEIIDKFQFCSHDGRLISYKNNALW